MPWHHWLGAGGGFWFRIIEPEIGPGTASPGRHRRLEPVGPVNQVIVNRIGTVPSQQAEGGGKAGPAELLSWGRPAYGMAGLATVLMSGAESVWLFVIPLWISIGMVGLLSANAMSLAMAAARRGTGTGSAILGTVQFGVAFAVSTGVAVAGTESALPMSLGLFLPAASAVALWAVMRPNAVAAHIADQMP